MPHSRLMKSQSRDDAVIPEDLFAEPCSDCAYLVGAGPGREAHAALSSQGASVEGYGVYHCAKCAFRWELARMGWKRRC